MRDTTFEQSRAFSSNPFGLARSECQYFLLMFRRLKLQQTAMGPLVPARLKPVD